MKSNLLKQLKNYFRIKKILPKSRSNHLKGKTIVFNSARVNSFSLHIELFLAYLLAQQGAKTFLLLDDGLLEHWDTKQLNQHNDWRTPFRQGRFVAMKHALIERLITSAYKNDNLKIIHYSQIELGQIKPDISSEHAHHAKNSWVRYFQTEPEDAFHQGDRYFNDSLINCEISESIGRYVVEILNPDLFITSHGIHSVWGPCYDLIRNSGIPALVWSSNVFSDKSIRLSSHPMIFQSKSSDWDTYGNERLGKHQRQKIEKYFHTRLIRNSRDTKLYYKNYDDFRNITFDKKKNTIMGMFPNVLWDNNIEGRNTIFKGILNWMIETIRVIRDTENHLIIRFHPSENTIMKKDHDLESLLRKYLPDVDNYKNVELISSSDNVNTYDLFKFIDIGIVYSGTLAMEMTYENIPVISCARGAYHGTGFAYEPETLEEYTELIKNVHQLQSSFKDNRDVMRERLLRFAHWYFFINDYHLPIMADGYPPIVSFDGISKNHLDPSKNPDLKKTVGKIKTYIKN